MGRIGPKPNEESGLQPMSQPTPPSLSVAVQTGSPTIAGPLTNPAQVAASPALLSLPSGSPLDPASSRPAAKPLSPEISLRPNSGLSKPMPSPNSGSASSPSSPGPIFPRSSPLAKISSLAPFTSDPAPTKPASSTPISYLASPNPSPQGVGSRKLSLPLIPPLPSPLESPLTPQLSAVDFIPAASPASPLSPCSATPHTSFTSLLLSQLDDQKFSAPTIITPAPPRPLLPRRCSPQQSSLIPSLEEIDLNDQQVFPDEQASDRVEELNLLVADPPRSSDPIPLVSFPSSISSPHQKSQTKSK